MCRGRGILRYTQYPGTPHQTDVLTDIIGPNHSTDNEVQDAISFKSDFETVRISPNRYEVTSGDTWGKGEQKDPQGCLATSTYRSDIAFTFL